MTIELEFNYVIFEGKSDLEKQIERRLKGWNKPNELSPKNWTHRRHNI